MSMCSDFLYNLDSEIWGSSPQKIGAKSIVSGIIVIVNNPVDFSRGYLLNRSRSQILTVGKPQIDCDSSHVWQKNQLFWKSIFRALAGARQ